MGMSDNRPRLVIITGPGTEGWVWLMVTEASVTCDAVLTAETGSVASIHMAVRYCQRRFTDVGECVRIIMNGGVGSRLEPLSRGNKGAVPFLNGMPMLLYAIHSAERMPPVSLPKDTVYQLAAVDIMSGDVRNPKLSSMIRWLDRYGCLIATVPFRPCQDYSRVKGFALVRRGQVVDLYDFPSTSQDIQNEGMLSREFAFTTWFTAGWFKQVSRSVLSKSRKGDFWGEFLPLAVTTHPLSIREVFLGRRAWVYDVGTLASYLALMRRFSRQEESSGIDLPDREIDRYWSNYLDGLLDHGKDREK